MWDIFLKEANGDELDVGGRQEGEIWDDSILLLEQLDTLWCHLGKMRKGVWWEWGNQELHFRHIKCRSMRYSEYILNFSWMYKSRLQNSGVSLQLTGRSQHTAAFTVFIAPDSPWILTPFIPDCMQNISTASVVIHPTWCSLVTSTRENVPQDEWVLLGYRGLKKKKKPGLYSFI